MFKTVSIRLHPGVDLETARPVLPKHQTAGSECWKKRKRGLTTAKNFDRLAEHNLLI